MESFNIMKKYISSLLIALVLFTGTAQAQTMVPQGGTGISSVPNNFFLVGATALRTQAISAADAVILLTTSIRNLFSATSPIAYNSGTGVFSVASGFSIPSTTSVTNWDSFYNTPSTRITAGTNLSWSGNTLNATGGGGTPGGSDTQLQYNNAGAFGGMSGTVWDNTNRSLAITGATVTTSKPVLDLSQTWNDAAVTFEGMSLDVTSTASAAASAILNLKVAGVSKFNVRRNVSLGFREQFYTGMNGNGQFISRDPGGTNGVYVDGDGGGFVRGTQQIAASSATGWHLQRDGVLQWSTNQYSADPTTFRAALRSDAANEVTQRNAANAQSFKLYGTYTDASNYERIGVSANAIALESAGTGSANRSLTLTALGTGAIIAASPLRLPAGSATAGTAPLKLTSGTLNTTPEAGAIEFLTDAYHATITTGAARRTFAFLESPTFTGTVVLPNNTITNAMIAGSGTRDATTFYRGDGTFAVPAGGGSLAIGDTITSATAGSVLFGGAAGVLEQNNSNFFWDNTNNRLLVGGATNPSGMVANSLNSIRDGGQSQFIGTGFGSGSGGSFVGNRANGSLASPTTVVLGNFLSTLVGGGYDGTAWSGARGSVGVFGDGTWTTGSHPTSLLFQVTPASSITMAEVARFSNAGNFGLGDTSPLAKTEIHSTKNVLANAGLTTNYNLLLKNTSGTTGEGTGIGFGVIAGATDNNIGGSILFRRTGTNSQGALDFYTKRSTTADAAPVVGMSLSEAGSLTVGSTAVLNDLAVVDEAGLAGITLSSSNTVTAVFQAAIATTRVEFGSITNHDVLFYRNNLLRLTLDSTQAAFATSISSTGALALVGAGGYVTNSAEMQLGGSTNLGYAAGISTGSFGLMGAGDAYSRLIIGSGGVTEAASGVHPLIAGVAIRPLTITGGVATLTNTASLYIQNAMSATVSNINYALWVDDGESRFDGLVTAPTIDLGNIDTTLTRSAAGVLAVEGVAVPTISSASTLTNKRNQPRTNSTTSSGTLAPDLATANIYFRTTQTAALTISAPIGTPVAGEVITIYVDSVAAQTLTINATYIPFGAAFPAATTAGKTFMMTAMFNGTDWKTTTTNQN